jgi:hypothetical protein
LPDHNEPTYETIQNFIDWAASAPNPDAEDRFRVYQKQVSRWSQNTLEKVQRTLDREAAAETGAVEGLYELAPGATRTIAAEDVGWEDALPARSLGIFDSQVGAYASVRQISHSGEPISEFYIRGLHGLVCASQETYKALVMVNGVGTEVDRQLPKGEYKTATNFHYRRDGSFAAYAPPLETPMEMARLVEQTQSDEFLTAHPVLQASYVHHSLAKIHPFIDGNGRICRALSSYYTYKLCGLPLVIYADRKQAYFQALEAADRGNSSLFVDYVTDRVIDTIGRAEQEATAAPERPLTEYVTELESLIAVRSELTIGSATKVGQELGICVGSKIRDRATSLSADASFKVSFYESGSTIVGFPDQCEQVHEGGVEFGTERPAELRVNIVFAVGVARNLSSRFTFILIARTGRYNRSTLSACPDVNFRFEDVYPNVGVGADSKVELFVDSVMRSGLDLLTRDLRQVLRQLGQAHFSE